ncbi:MAG: hypothetical protein WCT49_03620 [Candidatus Paceibacterota bacterium]|jgi:hypothetical protein|nr:hypothetical protein [Candidatus Paceibacterota bacterium]
MKEDEPKIENIVPSTTNEGERNLNKEAADYYAEKYKNTKIGAVLASVLSLAPMAAVSAPMNWEDINGSYTTAGKEYSSSKQRYQKKIAEYDEKIKNIQEKIDSIKPLVDSAKNIEPRGYRPNYHYDSANAAEEEGDRLKGFGNNDEAFSYYLGAKFDLESSKNYFASEMVRIDKNLEAIQPKIAEEEKILAGHDQESDTINVAVPKNITAEQKETLKHQMDEAVRKMIEQNH